MLRIEVAEARAEQREYEGRRYQRQVAYAHLPGARYPVQITLTLRAEERPWPVGLYELADESFYVADGRLKLTPRLKPVPARPAAAAAAAG